VAAASHIVAFAKEPPTAQEVANEISKLTGLRVRVEQIEHRGEVGECIAFEAIPKEKISLKKFRETDAAGHTFLRILFWTSAGRTLLFATRIVLESMGGTGGRMSEKARQKYSHTITVDQLLSRHRWEQLRRNFILRPIAYLVAAPFLAIFWMVWMMGEVELKWQKHHPLSYAKKDRSIAINRGVPGGWSQNEAKR